MADTEFDKRHRERLEKYQEIRKNPPDPPGEPAPETEEGKQEERKKGCRSLSDWQDLANQRIEEAMQQGAFDDLPGKGKPLDLARNPFEPEDLGMAHKLLKDNDLSPAWMVDRQEVLAAIDRFRAELERTWAWHRRQLQAADPRDLPALARSWRSHTGQWQARVEDLNRRITTVNLSLPIWRLEVLKLRLADELRRAGAPADLDQTTGR